MPLSQINRNRIKSILILLLLIALAALLVISVPLMKSRDGNRALFIQQIQKECQEAYNETASLSRTAGADSAAILSRIRSNIHAIRVINNLSAGEGNRLLEDERVMTMQNMVDRYLQYLTTGMDTGEYSTSLLNSLSELQVIVSGLN